jgi:hypothetical protein
LNGRLRQTGGMETWEYFTTTFVANAERLPLPAIDEIGTGKQPKYSVFTLIPQLNDYGQRGWELVSIEPVQVGNNGDLRTCDAASGQWTYTYFAAFKRRTTNDPNQIPGLE